MKMRTRLLVVLSVALLLTVITLLPRISEARRSGWLSGETTLAAKPAPNLNHVQDQQGDITVVSSYHNDTSIPLRDMKPQPALAKTPHANKNRKIPLNHQDSPDPVVQTTFTDLKSLISAAMPSPILNFNGIGYPGVGCNCAPPDTNGEVGATQYVQIVNEGYQIFNKTTGASVLGPVGISTIWTGFSGPCETAGDGDPVVLYDQLANRWVVSQFAGAGVPTDECVAVSTTSDATGSYHRYGFHLGSNFFDYPHLGVWPDAYYMSMNVFNSAGTSFLGPQPFAFDRAKMLVGQAATFITKGITGGPGEETYLPADLDGSILPPVGAPASFVEFPAGGSFRVFHFHVDFATPLNSTFTLFGSPASAGFTARTAEIPQLGTTSTLDPIGDRLMFRLATRFFTDGHEATVGNFTVQSGGVAAPRWFELRNATNGPVTVAHQGTYQPDTTHRWMGAAAMDQQGNLALGYSASSSSINPQIRYTGRLAGDPVNTLPQSEATLFAGTGSQVGTSSRWGDYSDMTIDPVDDCTFWYTQEYYATTASSAWRTRIGSFKYPSCAGGPTPSPSPTPSPAIYDPTLKVPKCAQPGSACDSVGLLNGRDTILNGPEPNQPNTINNSCADGTSGTYHSDESVDAVKVSTLDGTNLAPGKTVTVEVKYWVWSSSSDRLDLYYAADANSPTWVLIGTFVPPGTGPQVLTTTYQLPTGNLQAVRARFRFQGAVGTCSSPNSGYDDHDDLVFATGATTPTTHVRGDFDGDGKADLAVWRPASGTWYIVKSAGGEQIQVWGTNGDIPAPADYDGDGRNDLAIYRPSTQQWYILNSSNGSTRIQSWGLSNDVTVPGDYDGDGKADIAVWRPSTGQWFILNSSTNQARIQGWGANGDIPMPGNYDGDSKTDITVWRPSTGQWFIINSSNGSTRIQGWGAGGDVPEGADYDADVKADLAVWRPTTGIWYIINSQTGSTRIQGWGANGDIPVASDYDGDGRSDLAVWRPASGIWYIVNSQNGSTRIQGWGALGDVPVSGVLIPR